MIQHYDEVPEGQSLRTHPESEWNKNLSDANNIRLPIAQREQARTNLEALKEDRDAQQVAFYAQGLGTA